VILCHDACLRLEMSASMNRLELVFHPRTREGGMMSRHPSIADAVAHCHEHYSLWVKPAGDEGAV
jgi:hypothetical protein